MADDLIARAAKVWEQYQRDHAAGKRGVSWEELRRQKFSEAEIRRIDEQATADAGAILTARACPWRIADRAVVAYQELVESAPDDLTRARAELRQHVEDVWTRYQQAPSPKSTPGRRGGTVYRGPGPLRMSILVVEDEVVDVTSVETATSAQRNQRRKAQRERARWR